MSADCREMWKEGRLEAALMEGCVSGCTLGCPCSVLRASWRQA